jgi:cysteinyl-tRNA synthetase
LRVALKLYNTLTRKKEPFKPLDAGNVRMYVCGPTVYDFAHIGNARPVIVFDVLFRLLRHLYGDDHVTYVRNITDVDDKINARAAEGYPDLPLNEAIRKVTEQTERQFHADVDALGCLRPTAEPRATEHIAAMTAMIETLVDKDYAYVAEDHVLFNVAAMKDYGKLSGRSLKEMIAGARVEVAPYKRDPMDFVLWKPSKPGEPSWASPAGIKTPGRPGWHIECSAMAAAHLGEVFDIHGGGIDLVFPHHENEIAQSRCAHGTKVMANYWLHNGFLQVEGEKMSKSLGNFVTVHELLEDWSGEAIRLAMLQTHYRQPINWTAAGLREATDELWRWAATIVGCQQVVIDAHVAAIQGKSPTASGLLTSVLGDDLNTPEAITVLRAHYEKARGGSVKHAEALLGDCEFLGVLRHDKLWVHLPFAIREGPKALGALYHDEMRRLKIYVANGLAEHEREVISKLRAQGVEAKVEGDGHINLRPLDDSHVKVERRVDDLIAARNAARSAKDFAKADQIRDELAAMGITLKDGPEGTTWEVAR